MIDEQTLIDALDARVRRRTERREFFRLAGASALPAIKVTFVSEWKMIHTPSNCPTAWPSS